MSHNFYTLNGSVLFYLTVKASLLHSPGHEGDKVQTSRRWADPFLHTHGADNTSNPTACSLARKEDRRDSEMHSSIPFETSRGGLRVQRLARERL